MKEYRVGSNKLIIDEYYIDLPPKMFSKKRKKILLSQITKIEYRKLKGIEYVFLFLKNTTRKKIAFAEISFKKDQYQKFKSNLVNIAENNKIQISNI